MLPVLADKNLIQDLYTQLVSDPKRSLLIFQQIKIKYFGSHFCDGTFIMFNVSIWSNCLLCMFIKIID